MKAPEAPLLHPALHLMILHELFKNPDILKMAQKNLTKYAAVSQGLQGAVKQGSLK